MGRGLRKAHLPILRSRTQVVPRHQIPCNSRAAPPTREFSRLCAPYRLTGQVVDNAAARWAPGPPALKRRLLLWAICALCPTPALIDALGLKDEARRTPRWFALALKAALLSRAWVVGTLLPPRPRWLPGTILRPEVVQAGSGSEAAFGCPAADLSRRGMSHYRISEVGPPHGPYPTDH